MDDDIRTAIDDCGLTQVFSNNPPPSLPRSVAGSGPINFECGRQHGNWTAGQTVFGSGIDDGLTNIFQAPRASSNSGASAARDAKPQPLSVEALKKLRKATEDEDSRRAAVAAKEAAEAEAKEREVAAAAKEQAKADSVAKAASKGFYLPKGGSKGIRIVSKDGKSEVIVRPQSKTASTKETSNAKPEVAKESAPAPAPASAEKAPAKDDAKAPSAVSRASSSKSKRVRIVGKNGEEAFVELPFMQENSKAVLRAYVPAVSKPREPMKEDVPPKDEAKEDGKKDKAQQERKAAQATKALRVEREKQGKQQKEADKAAEAAKALRLQREAQEKQQREERDRQANAVANAVMSGGLGGSRKLSHAGNAASVHTVRSRSRSPSVVNGIFDTNSKAPSRVSSRTMTPPPAQAASLRAASKASSHHTKPASIAASQTDGANAVGSQKAASGGGWQTAGSNAGGNAKPATGGGWPVAGDDAQRAPSFHAGSGQNASQHRSQRSKAPSPPDWQELGSGIKQPSQPQPPAPDSWQGVSAIYKTPSAARQPSVPNEPPPPPQRRKASTPPSRPGPLSQSHISRNVANPIPWNIGTSQNPIHISSPLPSTRIPSQHSATRPPPPAVLNTHLANTTTNEGQDPTIFAGTGWISPHPLSVAPAEFEEPPQDQISLCGGGKMTFGEWQRLREEAEMDPQGPSPGDAGVGGGQRRNWSRTSSGVGGFAGGGWGGERVAAQDWATGQTWDAGQGNDTWGAGQANRVPTVVSEHSQRSQVWRTQSTVRSGASRGSVAPSLPSGFNNPRPNERVQSVRSGSQHSAASSFPQSFNNAPPQESGWGIPQLDGTDEFEYGGRWGSGQDVGRPGGWSAPEETGTSFGNYGDGGHRARHSSWREPARSESPVLFRTVEDPGQGARVQLRMPWD